MENLEVLLTNTFSETTVVILLVLMAFWSVIWKGIALWKAARLSQKAWFVVLLVVNTVGLLEIFYIFVIAPKHSFSLSSSSTHESEQK